MKTQSREPFTLPRASHPISRRDIDPDALKVLYRLSRNGFKAFMVGGAVRDLLLGKKPKDFDIATDARPGQIKKLFANCFLIGRRFRLAHIRFKGNKIIEVATFRKEPDVTQETETDHNNTFGTPQEDAFRRDITINALFYDINTFSIIDYVGGLEDIKRRRVCIIGAPAVRYAEDPVRMWRVLRYAARQGFSIEHEAVKAIETNRHLLAASSGSRLYEELNKDLTSGFAGDFFRNMAACSLISTTLGNVGKIIEESHEVREEFLRLLDILDKASRRGEPPSQVVSYGLFFWPWACRIIHEKGHTYRDKTKLLTDEYAVSQVHVIIPKALRANMIHALEILELMMSALRTGRMRWSLTKKASYKDADEMFALISQGRIVHGQDVFTSVFHEKFPFSKGMEKVQKKRRRRYRRPKAKSHSEQLTVASD
jgi:poly(A) polymerase